MKIAGICINFLICMPIPIKQIQKHARMNDTRLEMNRGVILDQSGKPSYSGNLNVGPFGIISRLSLGKN